MACEMREDAGLQLVFDGSQTALEVAPQHPGHHLNAMSNRTGNMDELAAGPDVAYVHPEYSQPDAHHSGASVRIATPAVSGRPRPRLWWMTAAVVIMLLVIIAVLGGLLGSRPRSAPAVSVASTAASPAGTSINSNTGTVVFATPTADAKPLGSSQPESFVNIFSGHLCDGAKSSAHASGAGSNQCNAFIEPRSIQVNGRYVFFQSTQ